MTTGRINQVTALRPDRRPLLKAAANAALWVPAPLGRRSVSHKAFTANAEHGAVFPGTGAPAFTSALSTLPH